MKKETPENIEELKRMAANPNSWRERLSAVNELKEYDCQQSRDILERLAIHDVVFTVKEAAFRAVQAFGVTRNGKPIYLGKKPKGNLIEGINHKLTRVRDSLPDDFTIEDFKAAFQKLYPEAYDAYDGDKGSKLDEWLSTVIPSLPKKK